MTTSPPKMLAGRCLCGTVQFKLREPFRPVTVCHCRQCAQWTGHLVATTSVPLDRFEITSGADNVGWYSASEIARRGFCRTCGSALFWKPNDEERISIAAGSLDPPTGLAVAKHIFVDDKSDYYEIAAEAPCYSQDTPPAGAEDPATITAKG